MKKYLVITGGSKGIGEKTIAHFQAQGWIAINLSRTPCRLPGVVNITVDLASCGSIQAIAPQLLAAIKVPGQIALVHNAAFYQRDSINDIHLDVLQQTLQTNVVACVALNQILLPIMPPSSAIIYIGSTLAVKGVPGSASYIISKHAMVGLMKATCQDLIGKGIHTACVCPGLVDTDLLKQTMDVAAMNYLLEQVVIGKRLIQPQEIADVIYFCATHETINGVVIQANLGQVGD